MSGMLFEVQQYIECFLGQYPEGHVLITGGNAHFLERHLTPDILFCKYLSFVGLNEILKYVKKSNYYLKYRCSLYIKRKIVIFLQSKLR